MGENNSTSEVSSEVSELNDIIHIKLLAQRLAQGKIMVFSS